jgi:C1A family cysteine protease
LIFLFLFIITDQVHSKLSEEKRQNLLNKLTTKITLDNLDELKKMRLDFESPSFKDGIDYDPARIEKIMEEYDFPKEYNFLEDTNATIHVKDQMSCGCCWSHAATTALSYRYHKKNIEVDLSPQDGLSCYLRD